MLKQSFLCAYVPSANFKNLHKLGLYLLRFCPLVALDSEAYQQRNEPNINPLWRGLVLNITGCEKLYKTEENLAQLIFNNLAAFNIQAKLGIGPSVGSAWALSRFAEGHISIIQDSSIKSALQNLPIQALRIDSQTLNEIGISTIAELLKFPAQTLLARFGALLLKRLDQALGAIDEPLYFLKLPLHFSLQKQFESPIQTHEQLKLITLSLLERLFNKIKHYKKKAKTFLLEYQSIDSNAKRFWLKKELSLVASVTQTKFISSVLACIIEDLKIEQGVLAIKISAKDLEDDKSIQTDFFEDQDGAQFIGQLINNLCIRLGNNKVSKLSLRQSYLPEESFQYCPLQTSGAPDQNHKIFNDRPPYFLNTPQKIDAISLLPENPPSLIHWKGATHKIIRGFGPEKISLEWWHAKLDGEIETRDYFKLQDEDGTWLWVFRKQKTLEWFVQGTWS